MAARTNERRFTLACRLLNRMPRTSLPRSADTSNVAAGPPMSTSMKASAAQKTSRPALDELVRDARRRRFDVVVCWKLDRLGRNLKHLITLLEDFQALGVAFVSLSEGIDATTPAGRLQMHILGAIAEFERARIAERVRLGLARVRAEGRRLRTPKVELPADGLTSVRGLSVVQAAKSLGVSPSTLYRRRGTRKGSHESLRD